MALLDKINSLAKTAGEKTENVIEITKLNARIGREREHINEAKRAIGEVYYAKIADGFELLPEADVYAAQIKASETAIEEAQAEIERIRSGAEAPCDAEAEPVKSSIKYCTVCGAENAAAAMFCSSCGGRF